MSKVIRLTRDELFRQVWAKPLVVLAHEIGVSDVAIGKACRRAKVPLPGRGHWAKPVHERPKPPRLEAAGCLRDSVEFMVPDRPPVPKASARQQGVLAGAVAVAPSLSDPHPLVAWTQKLASRAKAIDGRLVLDATQCLKMRVGAAALDRALRILDALIKASELTGCQWQITSKGETVVACKGETIQIELFERFTRREIPPPEPKASDRSRRWASGTTSYSYYPKYEWVGTGELTIQIPTRVRDRLRGSWTDGKLRKLETKLGGLLETFPLYAHALRVDREHAEAERRAYEAAQARAREQARLAEIRRRLQNRMVANLKRWERSQRLSAFIAQVEAAATASGLSGDRAEQVQRWLAWARQEAECLDPLHDIEAVTSMDVDLGYWSPSSAYSFGKPKTTWWSLTNDE